jgi:hypothetical protein
MARQTTLEVPMFAKLPSALLLAAALATGCGAPVADDGVDDVAETDVGKTDVIRPVGLFVAEPQDFRFNYLNLHADKTFAYGEPTYCAAQGCPPAVTTGKYAFTRAGTTRYIHFWRADGTDAGRFAYAYHDYVLRLRDVGTSNWVSMPLSFGN